MNSRVGRIGGHSHDSRNLTFLFRSREATTHRVYLNEVDTPLARFWALPLDRPVQIGDDFTDRNQLAALTLHALFSHVPQTRPAGYSPSLD